MTLYHNHPGRVTQVKEKPFKLERDVQRLIKENLDVIMQRSQDEALS